jgi:large repetitive protein
MRPKTAFLFILPFLLFVCPMAFSQTLNIHITDGGWYDSTGFHNPAITNRVAGDVRGPGCISHCTDDVRDFFVFDLSGVTQPIVSAKLAAYVPAPPQVGYSSPDPSENYELHDVVTPLGTLVAGTGGLAAWNDLGTGVVYGSRSMTAADMGLVVEIDLNSASIAALNSNHGLFGIGGSITTLDNLANNEYTFGVTNSDQVAELRLTLAPEPCTLLLLGIGAISFFGSRRKRTR